MLIASFVAGCIPLSTKLSESKLHFLASLSAGLLISTSLVVIIPEGVETLYSNDDNSNSDFDTSDFLDSDHSSHHHIPEHTAVGLSLLFGFALMFIIDQLNPSSHSHAHHTSSPLSASSSNTDDHHDKEIKNSLELDAMLTNTADSSNAADKTPFVSIVGNSTDNNDIHPLHSSPATHAAVTTPTVGLVVHAAADGIALGASVSDPQLSMVVFFAIMLHKAPSAFALTTVLLNEGLSRAHVRKHLLLFSMSAPAGALSTYALLQLFSESMQELNVNYWTGIFLLFSGGTFLYVAMHAIQELPSTAPSSSSEDYHTLSPSAHTTPASTMAGTHPTVHTHCTTHKFNWRQNGIVLLGMCIPFILNLNHHH
ncbi:Zinc/iron permease [Mycotypha africana]|uniref:Zinc/iron permease n=1 Tax=Mycotypha africana TaxID=64632 RepID=UPI0023013675|nr:Zinc/iron permease [Mycotypha africana]KAI8977340.1 Zinc/iron permease [Mycotypha africana]